MKKITQDIAVLTWLKNHISINPMEALSELGCYRLSARIHQLRKRGHSITSRRISKQGKFGKISFAEYSLKD